MMNQINLSNYFIQQDIKSQALTENDLESMYKMTGSYEALFSKRARLYKERNLKEKDLKEFDFKQLLLEHYTFLKRPVLINNDSIFVGNSKKTI
jgi:arsenate reductase